MNSIDLADFEEREIQQVTENEGLVFLGVP